MKKQRELNVVNFAVQKEIPLYIGNLQNGLMIECSANNNRVGNIAIRSMETNYNVYDLEVFNMESSETLLLESDSVLDEEQFLEKIEEFLDAMS